MKKEFNELRENVKEYLQHCVFAMNTAVAAAQNYLYHSVSNMTNL